MKKYLAMMLSMLLIISSCNPYKKVADDMSRTGRERALLAKACYEEFPVRQKTVRDTIIQLDTIRDQKAIDKLLDLLQEAADANGLLADSTQRANMSASELLKVTQNQARIISQLQKQILVDCGKREIERHYYNTENTKVDSAAMQLLYDRIDTLNTKVETLFTSESNLKVKLAKKETNEYKLYFIIALLLIGLGISIYTHIKR